MKTPLIVATSLFLLSFSTAAKAVTVVDAPNDFLASFVGSQALDLDVRSFSVNFNATTSEFLLGAVFGGTINPAAAGLYVIGVNTGAGAIAPFGSIGAPNVRFDQVIVVNKNGTGLVTGASGGTLAPGAITIVDSIFTARVPLAFFTSTGRTPRQYGFNLWPRNGLGNSNQISDFAPDNSLIAIVGVPEPSTWMLMLAGFGLVGSAIRRGAGRRRPGAALA
jgi:hypothetical protein